MRAFAVLMVLVLGCSDDGGSNPPVDGKTVDAPAGAMCTGAVYDPCTSNAQCTSGNCKLFMQDGIQVCTQACSAGSPCPMPAGGTATCNNMMICKPSAANNCTR